MGFCFKSCSSLLIVGDLFVKVASNIKDLLLKSLDMLLIDKF